MYAQLELARRQRADRIRRMKERAKDLREFKSEGDRAFNRSRSHIMTELIELVGEVVEELDALEKMTGV